MSLHRHNRQPYAGNDRTLAEKLMMDLRATRLSVEDVDPVPLDDVMWDVRVDSEDDAQSVRRLLLGAADWVEQRTGYAIRPGVYQVQLDGWWYPGPAQIIKGPLRGDPVVEFLARGDTSWTALPDTAFRWSQEERSFKLFWRDGADRPDLEPGGDTVRIVFDAGFDDPMQTEGGAGHKLPDDLRSCLIAIVAFQYQKKTAGRDTIRFANLELDPILQQHRQFW